MALPRKTDKEEFYKANDFDWPYREQQYRLQLGAQEIEGRDVAHYLSKGLAASIMNDYHGPGQRPEHEKERLRDVLHHDDNLSMVRREINRVEHVALDRRIWDKAGTDEVLTIKESKRALFAASAIYEHRDDLDPNTVKCFSDSSLNN